MSTSLFNELEEQLTLAVAGLKHLNEVIGATASALSVSGETEVTVNNHSDKPVTVTVETETEKPAPKKKRATRKKAKPKLQAQPELQAEPDPDATRANDESENPAPINDTVALDPLGDPIGQQTNNVEPIDINAVRTKLQEVALKLNGDTVQIANLMQNRFAKGKLSEFAPDQYPALIEAIEGLVADDAPFDPLA